LKTLRIVFALGMGVLGGVLLAQTEADFSNWMKQVVKSNGQLKGQTDAKVVATEAKVLESTFTQVETYFNTHKMPDAAAMAKTAKENAGKAATAAAAGTIDAAALAGVGGSCQGCHAAHREKGADGVYKIK
jgi:cytochrome c556